MYVFILSEPENGARVINQNESVEKMSIYAGRGLDLSNYFNSASHATNMTLEMQTSQTG